MAIDLNAIKNRLKTLQSTNVQRNKLWKPEAGKTRIRIVPYAFNRENPFIEIYFHYNIGKKSYVSLETFGEHDPICEFAEKLKQTGSKEDWTLGKKLEPTLRVFAPIIVRGKEKEGVKFWGFGKGIYQELLGIFSDPDYGDISDPVTGRDIEVEFITPQAAGNTFGKTSMLVKPNQCPCSEDKEVLEMIVNGQVDIFEIHKKSTFDELKAALEKWLNPEEQAEQSQDDQNAQPDDTKETVNIKSQEQPQSKKVADVAKAFDELFKKK